VCCPSRGELLSGRYFHNIRNPTPAGGCMHVNETIVNPHSFGAHLGQSDDGSGGKGAGYTMGWFGSTRSSSLLGFLPDLKEPAAQSTSTHARTCRRPAGTVRLATGSPTAAARTRSPADSSTRPSVTLTAASP